ncbi:MAG: response regulator, partial [Bacteroidetes bacterium]|nr:response regulator [Bacteroidota bacterium]
MNKPVILCVDDEVLVLNSLNTQLKQFFGSDYRFEMVDNGEDALLLVKQFIEMDVDVPVVVTDHIMPGMKGDELLSKIYQVSHRTLNIMLTGQADSQAIGNAVNNGKLFRYIQKPWDSYDMNMTLKEAIRSYYLDKKI